MLERRSALASVLDKGGRDGADGRRRCRLGEAGGWSLAQVAGFPSTMTQVRARLIPIVESELPNRIGVAVVAGGRCLMRTGPEQIWILGREGDDVGMRAYGAIPSEQGAVTPLSHSRTRIAIAGDCARELLRKSVPIDVHPDEFRVGQFALTGLHHTPVLVHRVESDRYDIYAMRSFALTVWEWLADAAFEFGYDITAFEH
ncbi:MAG: sarcosine oxidase subunit gamma [Dongiaceae bacterium]